MQALALRDSTTKLCTTSPPASGTLTVRVARTSPSLQTASVYVPGGTPSMRYRPFSSEVSKKRWANTRTKALMCEWISQNTLTIPGRLKRTAREAPRG